MKIVLNPLSLQTDPFTTLDLKDLAVELSLNFAFLT